MAFSRLCPWIRMETGKRCKRDRGLMSYAFYHLHGIMWVSQGKSKDVCILFVSVRCCICNIFPRRHAVTVTHHRLHLDYHNMRANQMSVPR